jgi:hypothetical protein
LRSICIIWNFFKKKAPGRGNEKKEEGDVDCTNICGSIGEEAPAFPPLEAHEPVGASLQGLQLIGRRLGGSLPSRVGMPYASRAQAN